MVGLGTRGRPPYREVVTNGFLIDVDGKKMSKSVGNALEPATIIRLWTAMSDYQEEIRVGREILARVVEAYRKLRNTLRYLLANLYDFDPAKDQVSYGELEEIDRFILARYAQVATTMLDGYESYNWSAACTALQGFATVDLSAFYSDVTKDRMYTF